MAYEYLTLTIENKIAQLNFNRPEKANAITAKGFQEIQSVFEELDENDDVRVVVIFGNGKHFCAGIDLEVLMSLGKVVEDSCEGRKREKLRRKVLELQAPINAIENCRKPVLVGIHGACLGAGLDLIAATDMRYCTDTAQFSIKEIDLGMVADLGALQRLPKLISAGMVNEMAFTGRMVTGEEATSIGLCNRSFATSEEMQAYVLEMAATIAKKSPLSIRGTKEVIKYAKEHSTRDGLEQIAIWNAAMILSEDLAAAGQAAFTKAEPQFRD